MPVVKVPHTNSSRDRKLAFAHFTQNWIPTLESYNKGASTTTIVTN